MKNIKSIILAIAAIGCVNFAMATNDKPTSYQGQEQGQAQGQLQGQGQGQTQATNVDVNNRITNDVRASAASLSLAASNSKSEATNVTDVNTGNNTLNSSNGDNTQQVVVTDSGKMDYSGTYTVKSAPAVVSGNVYPTSPCMGGTSVGASGVGFGFSVGSSWTDDECGIRETARSFSGLGLQTDAVALLCTSKYAAAAPSCKK